MAILPQIWSASKVRGVVQAPPSVPGSTPTLNCAQ